MDETHATKTDVIEMGLRALLEREARRRLRALKGRFQTWLPCGDAGYEAGSGRHLCLALFLCWASDCSSFGHTLEEEGIVLVHPLVVES